MLGKVTATLHFLGVCEEDLDKFCTTSRFLCVIVDLWCAFINYLVLQLCIVHH